MDRYEDEIERYEEDAEDRYDNYDYDDLDEDDFDTGLDGLDDEDGYDDEDYEEVEYLTESEEEDYEDDMYDGYSKNSIGRIDPNDRTLTVIVTNTSGATAEAIIFGGNQSATQPAGVTVEVAESSHQEVREESKNSPFTILGMKMSVSNPLQFDQVLRIAKRTATGLNSSSVFQPRNGTSPQNFSSQLIDLNDWEMEVSGQSSLRFNILDGANVVFTFTIKARANVGNLLKGRNVAELSRTPRTTGLPQIDLLRSRPKPAFGAKARKKVRKIVRRIPTVKSRRKKLRRRLRRR